LVIDKPIAWCNNITTLIKHFIKDYTKKKKERWDMLQQVMTAPGKIGFHEVPVPEISEGEVLIKIMKIGICGSDIHVYHGEHPFTSYPVTQGHEVSGEVVKTGRAVTGFVPGQEVTIPAVKREKPSLRWCAANATRAATANTICARI